MISQVLDDPSLAAPHLRQRRLPPRAARAPRIHGTRATATAADAVTGAAGDAAGRRRRRRAAVVGGGGGYGGHGYGGSCGLVTVRGEARVDLGVELAGEMAQGPQGAAWLGLGVRVRVRAGEMAQGPQGPAWLG